MSRKRIIVSWSSGKDSAWMLHMLRQSDEYEITGLLTTFNEHVDRVAMHGVRRELAEAQARAIGIPLISVGLPWPCSNREYQSRMQRIIDQFCKDGIEQIAFGDLFLEEIRDYRTQQFANTGMTPLFPIWCGKSGTNDLAQLMLEGGLHAVLTCVDSRVLSPDFAGRQFDAQLLADLPATVDPCGENGEFHTFCYAGPASSWQIDTRLGAMHESEGFVFRDLMAGQNASS